MVALELSRSGPRSGIFPESPQPPLNQRRGALELATGVRWVGVSAYFVTGFYREQDDKIPDWQPPVPNDRLTLQPSPAPGA